MAVVTKLLFPTLAGRKNDAYYDGFWSKVHFTWGHSMGMIRAPRDLVEKIATDYEYFENTVLKGVDGIERPLNMQGDIDFAMRGYDIARSDGMRGWASAMGLPTPPKLLQPWRAN